VITDPMFQFPEMYSAGRLAIDGALEELTIEIFGAIQRSGRRLTPLMRAMSWIRWPRKTTLRAAKQNIHHHYDVGNEFYSLWLDREMAYTCAYFPRPEASLEEAQIAKFDHVCRKLRLKPNMFVIEAGCGWGGLALHMARHYGVRVRAYNISHQQILYARQKAEQEGLAERVEFVEADWRAIEGTCDIFASIGMLEHVGPRNYRSLGKLIDRVLKPGGRGIIHTIGQNEALPASPWIERRIFPGGYPPALSEMMRIFEPNGFSVLDVENLRLHYAQTLRHWLSRYEQSLPRIRTMFDEKFVRMWRFYLAGSVAAFVTGSYQLFQVVFNRAMDNDVAMTRDYLYRYVEPSTSER
jgi:cyclopropane-fatty-acyl-phospholipid synthase